MNWWSLPAGISPARIHRWCWWHTRTCGLLWFVAVAGVDKKNIDRSYSTDRNNRQSPNISPILSLKRNRFNATRELKRSLNPQTCRFLPRKAWRKPVLPLPRAPRTLQRKTLRCVCFFCRSMRLLRVTGRAEDLILSQTIQELILAVFFFFVACREQCDCNTCHGSSLRFLFVDDGVAEVSQVFQTALYIEVCC